MSTIYITGHRNPDFDSIASAYVYAHLKNRSDPENSYVPIRCGNVNIQTRTVFNKLKLETPLFRKDLYPRVEDVMSQELPRLSINDPLQTAIVALDETGLSILPIFDENEHYRGIISSVEVSHFLIQETFGTRPSYHFRTENWAKVLPGYMLSQGKKSHFKAPVMIGAMPFKQSIQRMKELKEQPLFIVGLRPQLVDYAIKHNFPAIILTGATQEELKKLDFSHYAGSVYCSETDTAETIRLLRFSTPLEGIYETEAERLQSNEDFDKAKKILALSGRRGLPVFDDDIFVGIVSRGSFLDRPRRKLILVDHNEINQSIPGARDADILEIIDHHRVGAIMSREPFSLYTRPVGCTCTILRQIYRQQGLAIPNNIAKLMLSAVLSDTLLLKSPTTTEEDRRTVEGLAKYAGIDWKEWGQEIFSIGPRLSIMDPDEAIGADFKNYEIGKTRFGIGQVEVQTLSDFEEAREGLITALGKMREHNGLDGTLLLITDVIKEDSLLLLKGLEKAANLFPYERLPNGSWSLPGILSRKKQLLPELFRVIEETADENR